MQSVLTGMGAVTSVGRNVAAACAAIHAEVARPRRVSEFQGVDPESQELVSLMGHPMQGYTDGFSLLGRWTRLARGSVRDLLSSQNRPEMKDRRFWDATGLMVVVAPLEDEVLLTEKGQGLALLQDEFLMPLHSVLGLPIPERNVELVAMGHVGTPVALEQGERRFTARELERVLVVAVDSYVDPLRLEALAEAGRLKTEEQAVGFMPGEAGVALLLEAEASARRRGVPILGRLMKVATGGEPPHLPRVQRGRALADCLLSVLDAVSPSEPFRGDIYSDLNGETWRAREWGLARARLGQRLEEPRVHLPCTSVGEVGAASGALGMCLALYGKDPFRDANVPLLVLSSSDAGEVGCVALQPVSAKDGGGRS